MEQVDRQKTQEDDGHLVKNGNQGSTGAALLDTLDSLVRARDARAEVYNEVCGHLQVVMDGFTPEERQEAKTMLRRWLPKTGCPNNHNHDSAVRR